MSTFGGDMIQSLNETALQKGSGLDCERCLNYESYWFSG